MADVPPAELIEGEALAVLARLDSHSVDAVVTDPPYCSGGLSTTERRGRSTRVKYQTSNRGSLVHELPDFLGDQRDQRSWGYWCALWLAECLRITRPGGSLLMSCDWRQYPAATDAVQAAGWLWRGVVVWAKAESRARPIRGGFRAQAEFWIWATAGGLRTDHEVYLPGVIYAMPPHAGARRHQTEKPVSLLQTLVQVAPPGGLVLDPFAGSGTTLAAAVMEGRRGLGVELAPYYVDIARRRVADVAARPALPGAV